MIYVKNVPRWERAVRVALSLAVIALGVAIRGKPGAVALIAGGVGLLVTGFLGFCPACALVGRRLDKQRDAGRP